MGLSESWCRARCGVQVHEDGCAGLGEAIFAGRRKDQRNTDCPHQWQEGKDELQGDSYIDLQSRPILESLLFQRTDAGLGRLGATGRASTSRKPCCSVGGFDCLL